MKKFIKDFSNEPFTLCSTGDARTLSPDDIGTHKDGWTITGEIHEDYFYWVNDFDAIHKNGRWFVKGNFQGIIEASSEKALEDFIKHHPYHEWDYGDI